ERPAPPATGNGTRWLSFGGSLAVTILVFLWIGRDIEAIDVVDAITAIAPPEILLFFVSSLFMSICRSWRLLLLLEPVGYRPGRLAMLLTVLVRNLFADLLPARLGGLIYLWLCRTRLGVSLDAASSSMAIAFVFDMIAVAPLLIVVGLVIAGELGIAGILIWAFGLTIAGGALVALLLLAPLADYAARLIPRLPLLPERAKSGLAAFAASVAEDVRVTRRAGILLPVVVLSVLVRLAKYTAMYFLLLGIVMPMGFGLAELPPHKGLVGLIAPEIAASLPISGIGGFGAYEGTWAVAFHFLGLPEAMAKLTGVAHHLFTQAYGAGIGLTALLVLFLPFFRAEEPRPATAVSTTRRWLQLAAAVAVWLGISTAVVLVGDVLVANGNAAQKGDLAFTAEETEGRRHLPSLPPGRLLFDSNRSGSFGIYTQDLDGRRVNKVVDTPAEEMYPDIDPTGRWVVYARARSTNLRAPAEIRICRLDGSDDRLLLANATFPSFTADGRAVIAERERRQIIRVDIAGGKEEEIFPRGQGPFARAQIAKPRISPDGQWVAFTSDRPRRWTAWAVRLQDGRAVELGEGCQPAWSTDPDVVYHVATAGMQERTGIVRTTLPSGRAKTVLDRDAPRGHEYFPAIAGGRYIFYGASRPGEHDHDSANYQLYVHDLKEGWTARLTRDGFTNRWPQFVPER
ncbi:flippase-like domain-containing protein, partial [Desulfoprunum benzoelyticum]